MIDGPAGAPAVVGALVAVTQTFRVFGQQVSQHPEATTLFQSTVLPPGRDEGRAEVRWRADASLAPDGNLTVSLAAVCEGTQWRLTPTVLLDRGGIRASPAVAVPAAATVADADLAEALPRIAAAVTGAAHRALWQESVSAQAVSAVPDAPAGGSKQAGAATAADVVRMLAGIAAEFDEIHAWLTTVPRVASTNRSTWLLLMNGVPGGFTVEWYAAAETDWGQPLSYGLELAYDGAEWTAEPRIEGGGDRYGIDSLVDLPTEHAIDDEDLAGAVRGAVIALVAARDEGLRELIARYGPSTPPGP